MIEIEEIQLRSGKWYVHPKGALGTCGFHPVPWEITHIPRARSEQDALRRAPHEVRWLKNK
jgi:hypothetical protein